MSAEQQFLPSPSVEGKTNCLMFALGLLSPTASLRLAELRLEQPISNALGGEPSPESSPFARAQHYIISVLEKMGGKALDLPAPPIASGKNGSLHPYLSGVLYGLGGESLERRDLPRTLEIKETDREGRDISRQIGRAALLVYNFFVGVDGRAQFCSVHETKDQDQVIKSFSQLIAANITSDARLYDGAYHAAQALTDHLELRCLFTSSERHRLALTGMIVSAFWVGEEKAIAAKESPVNSQIDTLSLPPRDAAQLNPDKKREPESVSVQQSEAEEAMSARNTKPLSREQCQFLAKLLKTVVDSTENLDYDLSPGDVEVHDWAELASVEDFSILGTEIQVDVENGGGLNRLSCVQAVASYLDSCSPTDQLSLGQYAIISSLLGVTHDAIENDTCDELPMNFFNGVPDGVMRELVEDLIDNRGDSMASVEDYEPLTAANLGKTLSMTDCLEAMSFRLKSVARKMKT